MQGSEDILQPYIHNLIHDFDDFIHAQIGSDEQKNSFIKHTIKVTAELWLLLPHSDFKYAQRIDEIIESYLKMSNLLLYNE